MKQASAPQTRSLSVKLPTSVWDLTHSYSQSENVTRDRLVADALAYYFKELERRQLAQEIARESMEVRAHSAEILNDFEAVATLEYAW